MERYDAIIVGASISGCRVGELIASKGFKVLLVEEHEKIGLPLKCAGLVSWRLVELLPNLPSGVIVNTVRKAKFFSPSGKFFVLKSRKPVYVIDRKRLDRYLAEKAVESGCEIKLATRFKGLKYQRDHLEVLTNKGNFRAKLLVGADGANSLVAKELELEQPKNLLIGIQATARGNFEKDCVELWFGQKIAPNFFAWVVPENRSRARIGLATNKNPNFYFEKFLEKRICKKVKPNVHGLIRFGLMKKTVAERSLLVGDAASMLKPFSGGGIVYSLIVSEVCANASLEALDKKRFDSSFLMEVYDKKWKKKLSRSIKKGLFYRSVLSRMNDNQLNLLFSLGRVGIFKKILESMDMDFLS